jgi:hypothetical protein
VAIITGKKGGGDNEENQYFFHSLVLGLLVL